MPSHLPDLKRQPDTTVLHLMNRAGRAALAQLSPRIMDCQLCPRLRAYCHEVARTKKREFSNWDYWSNPLPGFGDPDARVLVIGLAPAAHGGTRTGRIFCGDSSGDWLIRALHKTGFANQPTSLSRDDGLKLRDVYLTAVVRCAPPENKPTPAEIANCSAYLRKEIRILRNVKIVLVLGQIALSGYIQASREEYGIPLRPRPRFRHGAVFDLGRQLPLLLVSYHPSRRNTQTRMMSWRMWMENFRKIRRRLDQMDRSTERHLEV